MNVLREVAIWLLERLLRFVDPTSKTTPAANATPGDRHELPTNVGSALLILLSADEEYTIRPPASGTGANPKSKATADATFPTCTSRRHCPKSLPGRMD
jgi:hypothetical protein